jgi:hypothetical protein
MTRAPTTYELDRRAGMLPPAGEGVVQDLSLIKTNSKIASVPTMPMKIPALIEKVWLSDVTLTDGVKMQGTWLFLEVEPGKWLDEVDPGAAPLVFPKSAIVK